MTLPLTGAQVLALAALRVGLPATRVVVVGAAALGYHVPLPRTTADIDLAIVVAPADLAGLLAPLGWRRHPQMHHRWCGPAGVVADVLPATADLLAAGEVRFDDGAVVMSLVGFDLALRHTVTVPLGTTGQDLEIAALPVLVVLKIVAWLDRPHERRKDLGDLAYVLDAALAGLFSPGPDGRLSSVETARA